MKIAAKKRGFPEAARMARVKAHEEGRKNGSKVGRVMSEEHKRKISQTLKGRGPSEECRRLSVLATKGKVSPRKGKKYPKLKT